VQPTSKLTLWLLVHEKECNVKINVETSSWPAGFPARRTSVSSFGYGGTNGHVIVESVKALYPWYQHGTTKHEAEYDHSTTRPLLLCFSAHDKPTLTRNITAIGNVAARYYPVDLALTLNTRRTKLAQRAFTIIQQGNEPDAFTEIALKYGAASSKPSSVGYLFTGQGVR
jgi:acyl transferase domain-containing protein